MNQNTDLPLPLFLASVAVRTAIVLLALLVGIRLFGKRDFGGMNLMDIALILLLGNAVQNAMTKGSGQIGVGLVAAATLLLLKRFRGVLFARLPWFQKQFAGEVTILVTAGRIDRRAMQREGVEEEELWAAIRSIGLSRLEDVRLAVLEDDGDISVIPKEDQG